MKAKLAVICSNAFVSGLLIPCGLQWCSKGRPGIAAVAFSLAALEGIVMWAECREVLRNLTSG